jgi:hypothetical protein
MNEKNPNEQARGIYILKSIEGETSQNIERI